MSAYQVVCCLMTFRFDRVRYLILFRINISSKVFIFFIILRSKICSNRQKDLDQSLYVKRSNVYSSFICMDTYSYIPDMFSQPTSIPLFAIPFLAFWLRPKEYSIPGLMEYCSFFITSWIKATCFVNMEHICAPYISE